MAQKNFILPISFKMGAEFVSPIKLSKEAAISLCSQLTINKMHEQLDILSKQMIDIYDKNVVLVNEIDKLKKKIKKMKNEDMIEIPKIEVTPQK
jgi:hypothetical protein